jgi:asparagine synthase (glutamine-hydrolysing)
MCGIVGFISREEKPGILQKMLGKIAHRGPDGEGQWNQKADAWRVNLGHRRLSIIDLETGSQPLAAGGAQIIFNGEIYNYKELRGELTGTQFHTQSDTEVLLQTILTRGTLPGLRALNGMFAFALWHEGTLLLARDRVGIKPLYYSYSANGELIFASELGAMMEHPAVSRKIDPAGLAEFFFLDYSQPPKSLLRDVKKLEPGCYLTWKDGVLSESSPYWELGTEVSAAADNEESLAKELWLRLGKAVDRQMIADVPVGILLSGGLDSSAIASLAAKKSRERIRTFSIGFDDPAYDESAFARLMAKELNAVHTERTLDEGALLASMESILNSLDEPMADPSLLPTSLLAKVASEHVKVALGGDGGDELWAGYPTYSAHKMASAYSALPGVLREKFIPWAVEKLPLQNGYQRFDWKAKRFTGRWDNDPVRRHLRWMSGTDLPELENICALTGFTVDLLWENLKKSSSDSLNNELALDFQTYLPGSVLAKVDRASMAHGLEVRPPFLDSEFVDWSFSLPSSLKLKAGTGKYLLKKAAEAALPRSIVHRRKKGFGIPLSAWLRGPLAPRVKNILNDSPLWNFLNQETFQRWHQEHLAIRKDNSKPLWALIVLDAWVKRFGCEA